MNDHIIRNAVFITSSPGIDKCPRPVFPEYAFIGRSNVGKSSLLNMLTGRKRLAKTSSTPGKTRLINHFLINDAWYLVDLPGYGYAKFSRTARESLGKITRKYLLNRENLLNLFFLIDSRLPPQKIDLDFFEFLGKAMIPFTVLFTKTDKLTKRKIQDNLNLYREKILNTWEEIPPFILTSAIKGTGKEEILGFIEETNKLWIK